jgi:hypothetical protein
MNFHEDENRAHLIRRIETEIDREPDETEIAAEVHSDDFKVKKSFNAVEWFEQASTQEILALAKCDWGGDYDADAVAGFFSNNQTRIVWDYLEHTGEGFGCSVDEKDAMNWLRNNRPEIWKYINDCQENDVEIDEGKQF